jgi:hypothetical protein
MKKKYSLDNKILHSNLMDKFIILIEIDIANLFYLKNYINEKLKIKILKKYIFFFLITKEKIENY